MMTKNISRAIAASACLALMAACGFERSGNALAPTSTTNGASSSFMGLWASQTLSDLPSVSTCGNLQWQVTAQTSTALAGNFSATCGGGIAISGSASGQLGGATIPITATGNATAPGVLTCPFSLTGT